MQNDLFLLPECHKREQVLTLASKRKSYKNEAAKILLKMLIIQ